MNDFKPIAEAKHDCTLYELMVPSPHSGLRDAATSLTIGSNNGDHDGEDRWTYVGWDWDQDRYIHMDTAEGDPAPTLFREMRPDHLGQPASEPDPATPAVRDTTESSAVTFANIKDVSEGTKLVADGGFECIASGATLTVEKDQADQLFVPCQCGSHYLDGQIDDEGGVIVGLSLAEVQS